MEIFVYGFGEFSLEYFGLISRLSQLPEVLLKASQAMMQIFSTQQFPANLIFIARNGKERNPVVERSCGSNNIHSVVRWGSFSAELR